MIDQPEALTHATALMERVRRAGLPLERARSLAYTDLRAVHTAEVDQVLAAVLSILDMSSEPAP